MLRKIVSLSDSSLIKERGNVIVIEDTLELSGRQVLKSLIRSLLQKVDLVHVFLYEVTKQQILKGFTENSSKIEIHEIGYDLHNWNKSRFDEDLITYMTEFRADVKVAVVFDSLSKLILNRGVSFTCKLLNRLSNTEYNGVDIHSIVGLVHLDLHSPPLPSQTEYSCDVVISCSPSRDSRYSGKCSVLAKKQGGKVIKTNEYYLVSSDFQLVRTYRVCDVTTKEAVEMTLEEPDTKSDPTANLTFNLKLSEREKSDRSQLQLPYTLDNNRKASELCDVSGGKVFYQPDDVDDWDEEDPDDDLNI